MSQETGPSSMNPNDPNFEEWCLKQLEEDDYLVSDDEDGNITESEHDTESEQPGNEELEKENTELRENLRTQDFFYEPEKKNPTTWSKQPPPAHSRTRRHNLVVSLPGLRGPSKKLGKIASPVQVWDLLFSKDMVHEVIQWTNQTSKPPPVADQSVEALRKDMEQLFGASPTQSPVGPHQDLLRDEDMLEISPIIELSAELTDPSPQTLQTLA
ncbi:hypothetical protein RN001_015488 [Aquatica leii]|uniref:Uncharacterized protein n=1 Tax=Aquatica leii TaxID=1421715 RepID=A0AAN7NZ85_9COLE|nr:hypothetical protein RN001_015488 [Aquatica leii]